MNSKACPEVINKKEVEGDSLEHDTNKECEVILSQEEFSQSENNFQEILETEDAEDNCGDGVHQPQISSSAGDLHTTKSAKIPAKARLQNLEIASEEKLKQIHKKKQDLQQARNKRLQQPSAESLICSGTLAE